MVSLLAFYSDGLISNPAEVYKFSVGKNENKQKEAGSAHFFLKCMTSSVKSFESNLKAQLTPR